MRAKHTSVEAERRDLDNSEGQDLHYLDGIIQLAFRSQLVQHLEVSLGSGTFSHRIVEGAVNSIGPGGVG